MSHKAPVPPLKPITSATETTAETTAETIKRWAAEGAAKAAQEAAGQGELAKAATAAGHARLIELGKAAGHATPQPKMEQCWSDPSYDADATEVLPCDEEATEVEEWQGEEIFSFNLEGVKLTSVASPVLGEAAEELVPQQLAGPPMSWCPEKPPASIQPL